MKLHPRVTRAGLRLVKRFEGYRRHAARSADGGHVLGYGHTLTAREGAEVSEADAEALLWFDLSRTAEGVERVVLAPTSDAQFEALTAFAFDIGLDDFAGSTVVRRLNEGAYLQAAAAIELWRRADFGGEVLVVDALVRRRAAEKAHFLALPEGSAPPSGIRPRFDRAVVDAALAWGERAERTAIAIASPDGAVSVDPAGRALGDWAPSAAIAAADAVSARLSLILSEAPPPAAAPPAVAEPEPPPAPASIPTPFDRPPAEAPSPAAPPPVRAFSFEPPSLPQASPSPFDLPTDREPAQPLTEPAHATADRTASGSWRENPNLFAVLGLVGLALFVAAVLCMFRSPSLLCLLCGLAGVLAMAPAAAFFLFRVLGTPVDLDIPTARSGAAEADRPVDPFSRNASDSGGPRPAA